MHDWKDEIDTNGWEEDPLLRPRELLDAIEEIQEAVEEPSSVTEEEEIEKCPVWGEPWAAKI